MFFVLVKKFFYDKVVEILNNRENLIEEEFKESQDKLIEAENLKEEYEVKLSNFSSEVVFLKNEAIEEAEALRDEIITKAKEDSQKIMDNGAKDLEKAKVKAKSQVKEEIIDISFDIVNKVLNTKLDKKEDEKIILEAVESLDKV